MSDYLRIYRLFGIPIFCLLFTFTLLSGFVFERRFLLERFASTKATVTATEPYNHGRLYYAYTVNGNPFTGLGAGSALRGTEIKVYYLLSDPSVSTEGDPSARFAGLFRTALIGAIFVSIGASLGAYFYARHTLTRYNRSVPPLPSA